jgi:hypothetical protein
MSVNSKTREPKPAGLVLSWLGSPAGAVAEVVGTPETLSLVEN